MNRKILVSILFIVLFVALFSFVACGEKADHVFTYYRTATENGASTEYVLTIDEKNNTFSVNCESIPGNSYSGTFIYKNGYIVLTSNVKGEEYVSLIGDEFSYFTPQSPSNCVHVYELVSETAGTCVKQGLKTYVCSLCGKEKQESTTLGSHAYEVVSHTVGSCTKKEKTVYRCRHCQEEKTVEGSLDPNVHTWSEENRFDGGCTEKITVTRRCRDCDKVETVREETTYGSHTYGADGVCSLCGFDESGFCHTTIDEDEDGIRDGYDVPVNLSETFAQNGYALSDGVLYYGVYPSDRVEITAEELTKNGKKDPITGYYRYQNVSYLLSETNGEAAVYVVKMLTWKLLRENGTTFSYVCTTVVDAGYYLSPTEIVTEETWVEVDKKSTKITTYYHKDPAENGDKIKANVYLYSDACKFLNGDFLSAFNENQRALLTLDAISLPTKAFADENKTVVFSDYARDRSSATSYFTCTPCEKSNAAYGSSFGECTEKNVTSILGYVPVITIRFPE